MAVWGYARGAVLLDFASVADQKRAIEVFAPHQIVVDDQAGARPAKFLDRPNAAKLNEQLQRGDTLVIANLDRGFRTLRDFIQCYDMWKERGIHVVVMDCDLSDEFIHIVRQLAGWERLAFLDQRKETMAHNSHRTRYHLPESGHGFRYVGKSHKRKRVSDPKQRVVMSLIVSMVEEGMSWGTIARQLTYLGHRAKIHDGRKG